MNYSSILWGLLGDMVIGELTGKLALVGCAFIGVSSLVVIFFSPEENGISDPKLMISGLTEAEI